MQLFGLSVEDIASLLGVIGSVSGLIFYLFRVIVVKPMSDKSNALNSSIESLTDEVKQMRENSEQTHDTLEHELHEHEIKLTRHDEEIKTLFRNNKN